MNSFDPYKFNYSALDALRHLQEKSALSAIRELQVSSAVTAALKLETAGAFAAVRELQNTLNAVKSSMGGATAALEEYRKIVAPISESVKAMNIAYSPIFEQTRAFDSLNIKSLVAGLQTSSAAMSAILGLNLSEIASIIDALPKYDFLSDMVSDDFSVAEAEELYENGEITQNDINEEISEIVSKKQFSPKAEWDKFKKSKWFLAIKILIILIMFICNPVTEYATDKALDKLGINEFWENSGVYDLIDSIFGEGKDSSTVSETEAKETVDKTKTGNVSKQRREDLLAKIKEIRTFISAAPQDENTGNLLTYLSELEKDVCGKKYGLVFEEHREEIDEVLATHTPVLTEQSDLFIDNGGEMNFLIEGDNLASLKLLEKTHKGKVDVIYIDPPYNTGNQDFIYEDTFVDKTDNYFHSKWLSFISERLDFARKVVSRNGTIIISIGYQEVHNLVVLCQEKFYDRQVVCVTVQTSGGKPNGGFNYTQEYLVFVTPSDFSPKAMSFTGGVERSPFEGLTLSTFDKTTRPNQTYPIFIDKKTMHIVGTGKSLTERIADGSYQGLPKDFPFDYSEAPDGTAAIWPISSKGAECVWRLISSRLMHDWECGYIKVSKNKSKVNPNEYSVQYLPDGVIKKVKSGELETIGTEENMPTLLFGKNQTVGSEIPTIWTEKDFYTTKGSSYVRGLFGDKRFPYPKSLEYIVEILRATTGENSIVLDFFAGSGTTGEAVMALNKSDLMNRRFILCTNNENNICHDVTYERIKRVIDKENYEASLKYYKVDYIPMSERMYYEYADELLCHIRELVELENGVNFTGNAEVGIVLTEEELDEFIANTDTFAKCRKLYMGHDLLPSDEQEQILRMHGVEINIIPDYYYRDLQEG